MSFDSLKMSKRNRELKCLNDLCKVNPHVKLHKFNISCSLLPAPLILFSVFKSFFLRKKHILLYQCVRKHQQGRGIIFFFSYHLVKVGEFMKLSFFYEDIVSTGFTCY